MAGVLVWESYGAAGDNSEAPRQHDLLIDALAEVSRQAVRSREYGPLEALLLSAESSALVTKIVLCDPDGQVLASTRAGELGLRLSALPGQGSAWRRRPVMAAAALAGHPDPRQNVVIGQLAWHPGAGGGDEGGYPWGVQIVTALLFLLAASMAGLAIGTLISRRLERLSAGAVQVASGDFDVEVDASGNDEIADMGRAFNFMVHTIKHDLVALQQEIEDRKRTETELASANSRVEATGNLVRDALENLAYGVMAVGSRGEVELFNRAAAEMFEYSADVVIGAQVGMLFPADGQDGLEVLLHSTGDEDRVSVSELMGQRATGELFPLQVGVSVVNINDARGALVAIIDLTGTKELQNQLAQSQRLEAVGGLTGGIAHDFNNILHVIMSSLDLLSMNPDEETATEVRGQAQAAATRGSELIKKLMVFARSRSVEAEVVDLAALVNGMQQILTRTISEDIELRFEVEEDAPLVEVDRSMMENIILNLCINARDAMSQGGRLTVSVQSADCTAEHLHDREGNLVSGSFTVLRVSDTGVGMSPALLKRVFEPYFSTKDIGQGSGLGLSMVYGFMHENNGHILVDSSVGMGTAISLYLREHTADSADHPTWNRAERLLGRAKMGLEAQVDQNAGHYSEGDQLHVREKQDFVGSTSEGQYVTGKGVPGNENVAIKLGENQRVLVVEDDADVRKLTLRLLTDLNYCVVEAADGPAALRRLDELDEMGLGVDVVFSDVVMPFGMSGIDLSIAIWGRYPNTPVVLTSGYPEQVLRDAGLSEEDLRHIQLIRKPFTRKTLADTLSEVLTW